MILNHHGYAFFGLVLLAIYVLARLAVTPESLWTRFKVLVLFGCAEIAALGMTSFLWGPFLFAMAEHRGMGNSAFPILIPNPFGLVMLVKLFRWSALGDGSSLGYAGLSIGVLAVMGAVYAVRRRLPAAVGLSACALASLLMVRNHLSYNVKNVDFFLIFICALTPWAAIALVETTTSLAFVERARLRWAGRFPARVAAVLIVLMVVDLGPTTFQSVFRENYEFKQPMYQQLAALGGGPYKVIERQVLTYDPNQSPAAFFDKNKLGIPSAYAATQTPLGFFHEGAGLSFGYTAEIVKHLQLDLNDGRLSERSADGLYVLGVKDILFRDRYQWFTPRVASEAPVTVGDGRLQLAQATPIVFSRRVIGTADIAGYPATDLIRERRYLEPETFDYSGRAYRELVAPLLDTMRVDRTNGRAATLVSRDGDLRADLGPGTLQTSVVDFVTDLKRVAVHYRSNADAFAQLPYNYFPYLHVSVDGQPVPFYRSAMNHILLRAPAGDHVVSVLGVMPPLQVRLLWLSLGVLAAVLCAPRALFATVPR
jgi:hypothetical protein